MFLGRVVRPIPYIHAARVSGKHEGMFPSQIMQGASETLSHIDFAAAGQDALAVVNYLCVHRG